MPVRINRRDCTHRIQSGYLFGRQTPTDRPDVLAKLFLVARTDDNRCYAGPPKHPVQGKLRHRFSGLGRQFVQDIDNAEQEVVTDLRTCISGNLCVKATLLRPRLTTSDLTR